MRGASAAVLLAVTWLGGAAGQEVPNFTKERKKAVEGLIDACVKGQAVKIEGKGAAAVVRIDAAKLKEVVASRRAQINSELIAGLEAFWGVCDPPYEALAVALLRACAEEKKDERGRGVAAFLQAKVDEQSMRLAEAVRGYQAAIGHFVKAKERPWQATSWNNLAGAQYAQGAYAEALKSFRQALEVYRGLYPRTNYPRGHADLARALSHVGIVLAARGEYAEALKHHRAALAMRRELYPETTYKRGHPDLASSLSEVGIALQAQGEYAEAQRLFRQALEMYCGLLPKEAEARGHPDLARAKNNLAGALFSQGEYTEALTHFRQALSQLRALHPKHHHPDLAQTLGNMGVTQAALRDYAGAQRSHREAMKMWEGLYPRERYRRGHPNLAASLNNLGFAVWARGEYAEALTHFRQALEMRQALYPAERYKRGHPDVAESLNNVGVALQSSGEYAEALKSHRAALAMRRQLYPSSPYKEGHPHLALSLSNVAGTLWAQRKYAEAEKCLRDALAMRQHELDRLAGSAPEDVALSFAASLGLTRDVLLSAALAGRRPAAEVYAALWPGRSAVTRVQERRHLALLAAAGSPEVQRLYRRLLALRQEHGRLLLAPAPLETKPRDRRLGELDKEIDTVEEALLPLLPVLSRSQELARSRPGQLQKALPSRSAFIDLLRYALVEQDEKVKGKKGERRTPSYVAFVVSRGATERVELGKARPIDAAVDLWRRALAEGSPAADRHAREVRRLVWDKLAVALKGTDTLYLAPDGALTRLPWAALPGDRAGSVLLEQYALAVVPHGAFLLDRLTARAVKEADKGRPTLLVLGGVRYDDKPKRPGGQVVARADRGAPADDGKSLRWGYLPGAAREVRHIQDRARQFQVTALTGSEASVERVLAELSRATVAHLATHGFFADEKFRSVLRLDARLFERLLFDSGGVSLRVGAGARNPLVLSGLVLAGANRADTPGRGILTGNDITRLDLRQLQLAVLSACESGLGEVGGGEGVYGLQRAFHVAGCQNVVASLWKVDDRATCALMELFYRYLWEGKLPPLQALRQAQLAMYHNPGKHGEWARGVRGIDLKAVYTGTGKPPAGVKGSGKAHPSHWAAFVLSGVGK